MFYVLLEKIPQGRHVIRQVAIRQDCNTHVQGFATVQSDLIGANVPWSISNILGALQTSQMLPGRANNA